MPNFLVKNGDKQKQDRLNAVAPVFYDFKAKIGEEYFLYTHKAYESKDYTYSAIFLEKAIENGNDDTRVALANIYRDGKHVRKDVAKSNRLLLEAAKNGNARTKAIPSKRVKLFNLRCVCNRRNAGIWSLPCYLTS